MGKNQSKVPDFTLFCLTSLSNLSLDSLYLTGLKNFMCLTFICSTAAQHLSLYIPCWILHGCIQKVNDKTHLSLTNTIFIASMKVKPKTVSLTLFLWKLSQVSGAFFKLDHSSFRKNFNWTLQSLSFELVFLKEEGKVCNFCTTSGSKQNYKNIDCFQTRLQFWDISGS